MAFWFTFFLWAAFTAVGELLRPRQKIQGPQPAGIGDFKLPTAQEGRPIPAVFGTVKIPGPNVVWYGDFTIGSKKKKVRTGLFSSQTIVENYYYYLGQQLVLCHGPIDSLEDMLFDDRSVPRGSIEVTAFDNRLDFTAGGPTLFTAAITPGVYANEDALAQEVETQMIAAASGQGYKCSFGYLIKTGVTDEVAYAVRFNDDTTDDQLTTVSAGHYSGASLAAAVAAAINAKEVTIGGGARIRVEGSWAAGITELRAYALKDTVKGFHLRQTNATRFRYSMHWLMGFAVQSDYLGIGNPGTIRSEFNTDSGHYIFESSVGTGPFPFTLLWGTSLSAADHFGFYSQTISGRVILAPRDVRTQGMIIVDGVDSAQVAIYATQMFGGDDKEGGVFGDISLYKGTQTQSADPYLVGLLGQLPAYRGICYAVLSSTHGGFYVGTTPYLKPIAFVVKRLPNGLGVPNGHHDVAGDANPACALYDILTNDRWGLGISTGLVHAASFLAAAETLFAESLGISMVLDSQSSAFDLVSEILRHVDGVIFVDPATGMLQLRLARQDYHVEDLAVLDKSNVESCRIRRPSWEDTRNVVKISYVDRAANFTTRVVQAMDLANIESRGGEVSEEEFDFRGLSNAAAAQAIAARVLRTLAYPLAPIEIVTNRQAEKLRPGDVRRLNWIPLGISGMAVRITRLTVGDPRDGRVTADAVEDIFGVDWTAYSAPAASQWVDPIGQVGPANAAALEEVPYAMVIGPDRLAMALVEPGSPAPVGYEVWSDGAGGDAYALTNIVNDLTPGARLLVGLGYVETVLTLAPGSLASTLAAPDAADFSGGQAVLMIDHEMVAWKYIGRNDDGTYTLSGCVRGVMDTTPVPHQPGAQVWFVSAGAGLVTAAPYDADATITAKALLFNSISRQGLADAAKLSVILNSRALRPYVPTDVKVNASSYPSLISGAIAVSWSHRNRLGSWIYDDAGKSSPAEAGTTYNLRFYDQSDVLRKSYNTGLATQTWTTEQADSGLPVGVLNSRVRFELEAIIGSLVSFQLANYSVARIVDGPSFPEISTSRVWRSRRMRRRRRLNDG